MKDPDAWKIPARGISPLRQARHLIFTLNQDTAKS